MKPEYILCAAIYYLNEKQLENGPYPFPSGWVLCGHRHIQIIELYKSMTGKDTLERDIRGFLTSHNRFVPRIEAAVIAFKAGQIKSLSAGITCLYSDELY